MKKASIAGLLTFVFCFAEAAQAALYYENGFTTQTEADVIKDYGGTATWDSANENVEVDIIDNGGVYTYGPGKTDLGSAFGTFTQSVDVYIDPELDVVEQFTWTCEVLLIGNTDVYTTSGEFDFMARKVILDDGSTEYRLGRNSQYGDLPYYFVVEEAGWFTFTTEWIDDGTTLVNHNYISQNGAILFQGDSVNSPYTSDPLGYSTGYTWFFGRDTEDENGVDIPSSLTLELDNLQYEVVGSSSVPEPSSLLIWSGLLGFVAWRRRHA